ncbi:MAG: hypothetical protein G3I11_00140 [Ferrovum sp.]|nr:hypothetical protein [Ferrovum sp.]
MDNLASLAKRRECLVSQISEQRGMLTQIIKPLIKPLTLADQGLSILHFFKKNRVLIASTGVLLSVFWPNFLGKFLKRRLSSDKIRNQ